MYEFAIMTEENKAETVPDSEQTKRVPKDPEAIGQGTLVPYLHTRKCLYSPEHIAL